ncbi:hypothetical protein GQ43DRAFT_391789 [Delitschia confertaspora ATCC 74209]|uniref:SET domain-containing protein n=1 Tax=Delitschia confertaspora ATCC 74209 TaxID=1513339 RepID=A0A9P4MTI8_9PLEO|nr:hypothetical protein GQ43DRAFT_391789 [Delitschia confertaspora ATCC 74209]
MALHSSGTSDAPIDLTGSPPHKSHVQLPSGAIIVNLDSDSDSDEALLGNLPSNSPIIAGPHAKTAPTIQSSLSSRLTYAPNEKLSFLRSPRTVQSSSQLRLHPSRNVVNKIDETARQHSPTTTTHTASTPTPAISRSLFPMDHRGDMAQQSPLRPPIKRGIEPGMELFGEERTQTIPVTRTPQSRQVKTTTTNANHSRDRPGPRRAGGTDPRKSQNSPQGSPGSMRFQNIDMGASVSAVQGENSPRPRVLQHITKTAKTTHLLRKSAPSVRHRARHGPNPPASSKQSAQSGNARTSGSSQQISTQLKDTMPVPRQSLKPVTSVEECHKSQHEGLGSEQVKQDVNVPAIVPSQAPKMAAIEIDFEDFAVSNEAVGNALRRRLTEFRISHALSVKHLLPRNRLCYERDVHSKARKGVLSDNFIPTIPERALQNESPFADMEPVQSPTVVKSVRKASSVQISQEVFHSAGAKHGTKSYMNIPVTRYRSKAPHVPDFKEYVTLRENTLTENNKTLLYWPYFDEEELPTLDKQGLWNELDDHFTMVNEHRPRHILQAAKCRVYGPHVDKFLQDIGITWNDILFWLLAREEDIGRLGQLTNGSTGASFRSPLLDRKSHCEEDFDRKTPYWRDVLSNLREPSTRNIRLSALACSAFKDCLDLSIWHLARNREPEPLHPSDAVASSRTDNPGLDHDGHDPNQPLTVKWRYRGTACRVCHLQDCVFHGEIREYPDSEVTETENSVSSESESDFRESDAFNGSDNSEESHPSAHANLNPHKRAAIGKGDDESSSSESDTKDVLTEEVINYKKTVSAFPRQDNEYRQSLDTEPRSGSKLTKNQWLKTKTHDLGKRRPFYPCSHEGNCEQMKCRCFRDQVACEKSCACHTFCKRRFPGCACSKDPRKGVCLEKSNCLCQTLNRECDPDLCGKCGAAEVLDPTNRYNDEIRKGKCTNVYIQLNLPKKTFLAHSEVHGFGLLVGEKVKAGEYLGEYKGEVLTRWESGRRGVIYHHLKTNYLFKLNKDQEVDSTRAGNKFRFINNSDRDNIINCVPRLMLCNTVTRIGMFATRELKPGEELYFNYNYPKEATKGFWERGEKPGTRNRKGNSTSTKVVTVKTKKGAKYSSTSNRRERASASISLAIGTRSLSRASRKGTISSSQRSKEELRAQTRRAREVRLAKHRERKGRELNPSSPSTVPPSASWASRKRKANIEGEVSSLPRPTASTLSASNSKSREIADSEPDDQSFIDDSVDRNDAESESEDSDDAEGLEIPVTNEDLSHLAHGYSSTQEDDDTVRLVHKRGEAGLDLRTKELLEKFQSSSSQSKKTSEVNWTRRKRGVRVAGNRGDE